MNQTNEPCANMPQHSRSSWHVRRAAQLSLRYPEIRVRFFAGLLGLMTALAPGGANAAATATPAPHPTATHAGVRRVDLTKIQPKRLLPKRAEHQEYVVEINKLGQVARVRTEHGNGDPTFNAQTYGNALQAFIRTPDGHVVLGTYRLTYDFDPKTARVRRDVQLLSQGGVNPDAKGAVDDLMLKAHSHTPIPVEPRDVTPIDPRNLPDLNRVTIPTPTPAPTP